MSQQRPLNDERPLLSPWNYALPTAGELAGLRYQAGLTQEEVAERIGVKQATVGAWESGRNSPRVETLRQIISIYRAHIASRENQ